MVVAAAAVVVVVAVVMLVAAVVLKLLLQMLQLLRRQLPPLQRLLPKYTIESRARETEITESTLDLHPTGSGPKSVAKHAVFRRVCVPVSTASVCTRCSEKV